MKALAVVSTFRSRRIMSIPCLCWRTPPERRRLKGLEQLPMQSSIQYSRLDWVSILGSIPLFSVKESEILVLFQNPGHSPSYSDVSFPWACFRVAAHWETLRAKARKLALTRHQAWCIRLVVPRTGLSCRNRRNAWTALCSVSP